MNIMYTKPQSTTGITRNAQSGFSLLELLVVVAIFSMLTAVTIYNYAGFNSRIILTNMAYEVSLAVREAQTYGLSVRGSGGDFGAGYGVFFRLGAGHEDRFRIFQDLNDDNRYTGTAVCATDDECIEEPAFQRDIAFTDFTVISSGGCQTLTERQNLNVSFKRPNPDACIMVGGSGGTNSCVELSSAQITLSSGDLDHYVIIRNNGQISVTDTPICN
jgi:prepilin-type N-terminal cleavage/methylation domain-containing protein